MLLLYCTIQLLLPSHYQAVQNTQRKLFFVQCEDYVLIHTWGLKWYQHNKVVIDIVLIILVLYLHHNRMSYINCKCVENKQPWTVS